MTFVQLILASLITTGAGMAIIPLAPSRARAALGLVFVLLNAILYSIPAVQAIAGESSETVLRGAAFLGDVRVRMDPLSAWFVLIINFTCVNGALYGMGYMRAYREQKSNLALHWALFVLFHGSMVWACMLQHGLAFLIAWELMSISSLLLILFEHYKKETLRAGVNFLVQMHIGVVLLSAAFIWVYIAEGSFDFEAIGRFFEENSNSWLFLLFFGGFGIKAGFIPLHSWLPHAHPAAPSHVSGVMSGVIVKMGIYGIIRMALLLKSELILLGATLLLLSLATAVYGILNAAVHRDFKKMLAYCTIENIGIIGAGIGLGLLGEGTGNMSLAFIGFGAALLHTLNHSLYKSLLFFAAGSVYRQTHTRDMEKLGGLIRKMPQTAFFFLAGALAIGGLPPFNGFVSEFLLYSGFLAGMQTSSFYLSTLMVLSLGGLAIVGGLSLLTFTKNFGVIFLGSPREALPHDPEEVSLLMRLPQYLIAAVMLGIGLFPQFFLGWAQRVTGAMLHLGEPADTAVMSSLAASMASVGMYSLLFIGLMVAVFLIRRWITPDRKPEPLPTWGCGYAAPNPRMQYTGKSFSKALGKLLGFFVAEKKNYTEITPEEIFPQTRAHGSHYADFFEDTVIEKGTERLISGMNFFQFIQNGRIQYYVLYGVVFILLIFLATLFNLI